MATLPSLSTEGAPVTPSWAQRTQFHETRTGWLVLGAVWALGAVYLGAHLRQVWTPSDSGTLAALADRTFHGQVPFKDFTDAYTGGLTYLNALAFRLFGENLFSLRIPLYLFFLGWVPSVYLIARRFARPLASGAVTLLAVAWSVPNYPEAMPSWYNLFFATWGVLALVRYVESEKQRWLWIAGICGGLSFLAKSTALYFVVAVLLFFVYRELSAGEGLTTEARRSTESTEQGAGTPDLKKLTPEARRQGGGLAYQLFASAGLILFLAGVFGLILSWPTPTNAVDFLLPPLCLFGIVLREVWVTPSGQSWPRFKRLFSMASPFVGGVLLPPAIFAAWLFEEGALGAWFRATFGIASRHIYWDSVEPATLWAAVGLVPAGVVLAVAAARRPAGGAGRAGRYGVPVLLAVLLAACRWNLVVRQLVGNAMPLVAPLALLYALFRFWRRDTASETARSAVLLVAAAAGVCSLTQFPIGMALYFCYIAPLVFLALLALFRMERGLNRVALGWLAAFYLVFAVWLRTPGYYDTMHLVVGSPVEMRTLRLPRGGGLLVKASYADQYEKLVPVVLEHARGPYIYVAPDGPEVYFLTGKSNPTKTIWDFLDPDFMSPVSRAERILEELDAHAVSVVVLNHWRRLIESGPIPAGLRRALDERFPHSEVVGRFEVRWRP